MPNRGRGLSVASLVLGILAVFPFSFLTGIPAVITGAIALAQKRLGRGMAIAGVVLGVVGSFVIGVGLILALILPSLVLSQERARQSSVKNSMHVLQTALEAYATDHNGNYPSIESDWSNPEDIFCAYLPGGDPIGTDGSPVCGQLPLNPYTGERYRGGKDLFYFPTRLTETGVNSIILADREDCPFNGIEAPEGTQGTIVVLGYIPGGIMGIMGTLPQFLIRSASRASRPAPIPPGHLPRLYFRNRPTADGQQHRRHSGLPTDPTVGHLTCPPASPRIQPCPSRTNRVRH